MSYESVPPILYSIGLVLLLTVAYVDQVDQTADLTKSADR